MISHNDPKLNLFSGLIEKLLNFVKSFLNSKLFDFIRNLLLILSNLGFYLAAVLTVLIGFIAAIRLPKNGFKAFLLSILFTIGFVVLQFIAKKFVDACEILIEENPTKMTSYAFLESIGLLSFIGGIVFFIINFINSIKGNTVENLVYAFAGLIVLWALSLLSLNPSEITIDIEKETSAGQEAIGIITFFIKVFMKLVPLIFSVIIIFGSINLLINLFSLFGNQGAVIRGWLESLSIFNIVVIGGLLPLGAYVSFLLLFLTIDIIKSILSLPEKIDKLKK